MNDLIRGQDAIDIVTFECGEWQGIANRINERIQRLPSAEPVQKTGHWQKYEGRFDYDWECSECGCSAWEKTDYCAHCGARMEREEE